jgi:uncharacterized repeat protein (TIGR01451 family)
MPKKKTKFPCKHIMNRSKHSTAVSEIIGAIFLLAIVISGFGVMYYNVSSIPEPNEPPNVTIICRVEDNNLVLEHQRGEPLNLDTAITLDMGIIDETFLVGDYLDAKSVDDGKWNIGERVVYPFSYNLDNIRNHFAAYLHVADKNSNSLVFVGTQDVYPTTDIGVTVTADNLAPSLGSIVTFTVIVTNHEGGTPAKNIEILSLLSNTLSYIDSETSRGLFDPETGIWNISYLESGESATLTLTTIVIMTPGTQLAMVLDGSGSISSKDWNLMRTGLANAIKDPHVFPRDGTVELTVIQFGRRTSTTQYARIELGPIMVRESNYLSIANTISTLPQLGGYTPMASGIYLAADTLKKSLNLNSSNRQVICMVTDGQPNCNCDPKTYIGYFVNDNYKTGRAVSEQARGYLINTLQLTPAYDQFVVIAVGTDTNTPWLKNKIVWPQPGNYAPEYIPGWVRNVSKWEEFSESVYEMFSSLFGFSLDYNVKIITATPSTDPKPGNNQVNIYLTPG